MFTIQYVGTDGTHKMQSLDSKSRPRLVAHLMRYQRPIVAVYEGSTPITRAIAADLRKWPTANLSREARTFAHSTVPA